MSGSCIFCKIINGEIASNIIYEDKDFMVILDRFPANVGHTLIIPKVHVANIYELNETLASKLFMLALKVAKVMKDDFEVQGLNILQNNGELAGQTVFHFHMHLIPRTEGDKVEMKWENLELSDKKFEEVTSLLKDKLT